MILFTPAGYLWVIGKDGTHPCMLDSSMLQMYGVAAAAHFAPAAYVLAWPSAESGALPVESGVAVAYGRELDRVREEQGPDAALELQTVRPMHAWHPLQTVRPRRPMRWSPVSAHCLPTVC